jgi:2-polyprenyl-3-methyl-5-hydroxy-6-metoxy-1,4-benzoquinol methylase
METPLPDAARADDIPIFVARRLETSTMGQGFGMPTRACSKRSCGGLKSGQEWIPTSAPETVEIHAHLLDLILHSSGLAIDVGAGSGRDVSWLVSLGYEVVAVESSAGMRREGQARHPNNRIRWLDRLSNLSETHRLGLSFDLILASAVWMHVAF